MIKDATYISISKVLTYLFSMIGAMLLARMLSYGEMGTYQQVNTLNSMVVFIMLGIPEAIVYFFSRRGEDDFRVRNTIYSIISIQTASVFLLCVIFNGFVQRYFKNPQLGEYRLQIAAICASTVLQQCFSGICVCSRKTKLLVITTLVFSSFRMFICCICYFARLPFSILLNGVAIYSVAYFVVQMTCVTRIENGIPAISVHIKDIKTLAAYSLPLFLSVIVSKLCILTDKLMVGYFFDTETYALYAVAARELPYTLITQSLISVTSPVMFRLIAEKKTSAAVNIWKKSVEYSFSFICIAVTLSIVLADELILLLYSDKYLPTKLIFIIYLFELFIRAAYWGMFAKAYNRPKIIIFESCGQLVCNILLNFVFIRFFGLSGAALATVCTAYLSVIFWIIVNRRLTTARLNDMLPIAEILKNIVLCVGLGICLAFFKERVLPIQNISTFARLCCVGILGLGLYSLFQIKKIKHVFNRIIMKESLDR